MQVNQSLLFEISSRTGSPQTVFSQIKSSDELQAMFDEHFVGNAVSTTKAVESSPAAKVEEPVSSSYDDDDDPIVAELLAGIGED